jgi:hypothetical protein
MDTVCGLSSEGLLLEFGEKYATEKSGERKEDNILNNEGNEIMLLQRCPKIDDRFPDIDTTPLRCLRPRRGVYILDRGAQKSSWIGDVAYKINIRR